MYSKYSITNLQLFIYIGIFKDLMLCVLFPHSYLPKVKIIGESNAYFTYICWVLLSCSLQTRVNRNPQQKFVTISLLGYSSCRWRIRESGDEFSSDCRPYIMRIIGPNPCNVCGRNRPAGKALCLRRRWRCT